MKKISTLISAVIMAGMIFSGCGNSLSLDDEGISKENAARAVVADSARTSSIKVYVFNAEAGKTWNVWAWREEGANDSNYNTKGWPGGDIVLAQDEELAALSATFKVDPNYEMGILFVSSDSKMQTKDILVPKEYLKDGASLYFVYGETEYYTKAEDCIGLRSAKLADKECKTVSAVILGYKQDKVTADSVSVKDKDGNDLSVGKVAFDEATSTAKITISDGAIEKVPYTVSFNGVEKSAGITADLLDTLGKTYDDDDLGLTLEGNNATFKVWAPLAEKASLLLYEDVSEVGNFKAATVAAKSSGSADEPELKGSPAETLEMTKDSATGVWSISADVSKYKYYKYQIKNNGTDYYVADIYAKSCSPDSIASQIVDINADSSAIPAGSSYGAKENYVNPFGNSGAETKSYSDAVIYEMHIRDWSRAVVADSTGKFLDIANAGKIMDHLKDLGVTHVQIVPMFDYAQVNSDSSYNWGYNPYHYNVPEGRYTDYSSNPDGTAAVEQMREMIKKFHENGIAVNMDVVYNHTSGTAGGSLYDSTVPEYFYRVAGGTYSNGSGCGNETATNHIMVKKYVVDSLKHWMLDYHINGFRFDLMGVHEKETMKEIYDELSKIDPNVMVYGEPWTGGTAAVENGANQAVASGRMGVGAFDDDFRDAIKGAEYMGFKQGQVQGTFNDEGIAAGLTGKSGTNNRNKTGNPALALHYVECHDNYTLFDKLAISYLGKTKFSGDLFSAIGKQGLAEVKAQEKLAAAYVFLSQGTPFLNGGQEFLRTKQGDENSYKSADSINAIDLSFKEKYSDVFDVYRGLIALRKDYSAFRNAEEPKATAISEGVTLYEVSAADGSFAVVFNATGKDAAVPGLTGKIVSVNVNASLKTAGSYLGLGFKDISAAAEKYTVADAETTVSSVPAKSFVILKK